MTLQDKVKEFGDLHLQIKELETQVKELKLKKEQLEKEIRHDLDEQGFDKITVDGVTVYQLDKMFISIPQDERNQEAINWLLENGFDDILRLTVPTQTLTAVLKEKMEEEPNIEQQIKGLFNVNEQQRVGIRIKK